MPAAVVYAAPRLHMYDGRRMRATGYRGGYVFLQILLKKR